MTLASGTKLGPYEVLDAVGAGGMGEVYSARDTRLGRQVAIKVLPTTFANDPDRLRRFEVEARTVASLNHPNILALHDIGEHEGAPYLVCELLEGESLRQRMDSGALGARKAVEYASQIAQGLAAAHDKGIVHRDLKPENVFLTKDGRVKLLDFGLAKLARALSAAAGAEDNTSDGATSPGQTRTTPGLVLGTAGYMSPEQVRGKEVDARTDIFSFGAVLYEMLSGQRAFRGESSVETMNAILKEDPQELSAGSMHVSPSLERMVRRCLEKNPEERFQSARDLAFALDALGGTSTSSSQIALAPIRKQRWVWPAAIVLVALAGVVAGSLATRRTGDGLPITGLQLTFREGYIRSARFSPDAKSIVYAAMWDGAPMQLYAGRVDSVQSQAIEPSKADLLSVSRTGEMAIALDRRFMEPWVPTGVLARVPLMGGAPRGILDGVTDADWSPDGERLTVSRRVGSRFQLEYPIGKVLYETAGYISHIRISPDGQYIAFLDHPLYGDDRGTVAIIDASGKKKTLTPEYTTVQGVAWSPDSKEIWYTGNIAMRAVSLNGQVRSVYTALHPITLQDISAGGLVLLTGHVPAGEILVGTVGGKESKNLTTYRWATAGGLSEDGTLAAINEFNVGPPDDYEIFARRADGSPATDLGPGKVCDISSDGKRVLAFLPTKPDRLMVIPTGVGETKTLLSIGMTYQDAWWLPDGKSALVVASKPGGDVRTYVQDIGDTSAALRPVAPEGTAGAMVSADGKSFIARDREARWWIYDIAGGNPREAKWMSSEESPVAWLNDGSVLVWLRGEMPANVYRVDVGSGKRQLWRTFTPSHPAGVLTFRRLFVTRDAKHYLYETRRVTSELFVLQGLK